MSSECCSVSTPASPATSTVARAAIVILSDPNSGSDESLGRLFNALATAYDYKTRGDDVTILFQGTGTRWIGKLQASDHPAHALFNEVRDRVAGASCGCADVFGAREEVEQSGFDLITDNRVPHTSGLPSLPGLVDQGFGILTF